MCGENGSGKSSLLKLLLGESAEHTGIITTGSGLKLSYVPQDAEGIKGSLTDFAQMHRLDESLFKTVLRKMGFERVQFEKDMKNIFESGELQEETVVSKMETTVAAGINEKIKAAAYQIASAFSMPADYSARLLLSIIPFEHNT